MTNCNHIYDETGSCFECGRGGARKGAGRPAGTTKKNTKVPFSTKIDPELLDQLKQHELPAAKIIDRALWDWFGR